MMTTVQMIDAWMAEALSEGRCALSEQAQGFVHIARAHRNNHERLMQAAYQTAVWGGLAEWITPRRGE